MVKSYDVMNSYEVSQVMVFEKGVKFTLKLNGVTIRGCRVATSKTGEYFISLPSEKGKDDKWYPIVKFFFSPDAQQTILNAVMQAVKDGEAKDFKSNK